MVRMIDVATSRLQSFQASLHGINAQKSIASHPLGLFAIGKALNGSFRKPPKRISDVRETWDLDGEELFDRVDGLC